MNAISLKPHQQALVEMPVESKVFLEGPAGAGKTTVGVQRLLHLLASGAPGDTILVLVPQRTLADPYYRALSASQVASGGMVDVLTLGGLAQRTIDLFWPLVAERAGFASPHRSPTFLTLETAQYFMARIVRPLLSQGYFETVTIHRNRLYSQILDNLNKAAVVGFPHREIGERLQSAWTGESSQARVYVDAQECAARFRQFCLDHNLLDFSLQIEIYRDHLWPHPLSRDFLLDKYRHLIVDNLEEDVPVTHDILREWLPLFRSALLIFDLDAGYRLFLGADPLSGASLKDCCAETFLFEDAFVSSQSLLSFGAQLASVLGMHPPEDRVAGDHRGDASHHSVSNLEDAVIIQDHRYHPEMLDWVVEEIARLVREQDVPPGEIALLAPFMSDALRFSLVERLARQEIPAFSHRPSRSLREEPASHCLLTLAALAHPRWGILPTRFDVAYALIEAIEGMDLVRGQLLVDIVYRVSGGEPSLSAFDRIKPDMQERITYSLGERYEHLRRWLEDYSRSPTNELDAFFSRLFGEVLSQPGYVFHRQLDHGEVAANLVESARKFRQVAMDETSPDGISLGKEYVEMVQDGVVAAQYIRRWRDLRENALFLAPAYTFLMSNRPVDVQFWLEAGSHGWSERLYQPLTHPYVLSRRWPRGQVWTHVDEHQAGMESMWRLSLGLLRRCRKRIYLVSSDLGEQGYEQRGPLLKAVERLQRRWSTQEAGGNLR